MAQFFDSSASGCDSYFSFEEKLTFHQGQLPDSVPLGDAIILIFPNPSGKEELSVSVLERLLSLGFESCNSTKQYIYGAINKLSSPGLDKGTSIEFLLAKSSSTSEDSDLKKIVVCLLPKACSRNNTPAKSHAVGQLIKQHKSGSSTTIYLCPEDPERDGLAQALAVARQYPLYSHKSSGGVKANKVDIVVTGMTSGVTDMQIIADSIRTSAALVDLPANYLHVSSYVEYAQRCCAYLASAAGGNHPVSCKVIRGTELEAAGFGGLYGVGKASVHPPALVVLSYTPTAADAAGKKSMCMVGKGIVYDTGGLSIKVPPNMCGMKGDMGGSAAVFGAFLSLIQANALPGSSADRPVHAILCIAENSITDNATRPDDIHVMLSGKSVEINNTDAEGRLVLCDGVFYASSALNADLIVDIATLTGAQLVCTGRRHAAIFTNDEDLEMTARGLGKKTGDLVFPMLYCPEFHREMFSSPCADMKNSVSDRMNAQSSCAGQFIGNHLETYLSESGNRWIHVDMAGPSSDNGRATGFGVALLYQLALNA